MLFPEFTHPDDVDEDVRLRHRLASGAMDQYELDKRFIRKDGSIVWGHLSVRYVRDAAGPGDVPAPDGAGRHRAAAGRGRAAGERGEVPPARRRRHHRGLHQPLPTAGSWTATRPSPGCSGSPRSRRRGRRASWRRTIAPGRARAAPRPPPAGAAARERRAVPAAPGRRPGSTSSRTSSGTSTTPGTSSRSGATSATTPSGTGPRRPCGEREQTLQGHLPGRPGRHRHGLAPDDHPGQRPALPHDRLRPRRAGRAGRAAALPERRGVRVRRAGEVRADRRRTGSGPSRRSGGRRTAPSATSCSARRRSTSPAPARTSSSTPSTSRGSGRASGPLAVVHGRPAAVERGAAAVRVRGEPRPAGAAPVDRQLLPAPRAAVQGTARRGRRRVHRVHRRGRQPDAAADRGPAPALAGRDEGQAARPDGRRGGRGRRAPARWRPRSARPARRSTVGDLPTVMADPAQLAQVFTNLVGNALKYRRPDVPPEVRDLGRTGGRRSGGSPWRTTGSGSRPSTSTGSS